MVSNRVCNFGLGLNWVAKVTPFGLKYGEGFQRRAAQTPTQISGCIPPRGEGGGLPTLFDTVSRSEGAAPLPIFPSPILLTSVSVSLF